MLRRDLGRVEFLDHLHGGARVDGYGEHIDVRQQLALYDRRIIAEHVGLLCSACDFGFEFLDELPRDFLKTAFNRKQPLLRPDLCAPKLFLRQPLRFNGVGRPSAIRI